MCGSELKRKVDNKILKIKEVDFAYNMNSVIMHYRLMSQCKVPDIDAIYREE